MVRTNNHIALNEHSRTTKESYEFSKKIPKTLYTKDFVNFSTRKFKIDSNQRYEVDHLARQKTVSGTTYDFYPSQY
jgi:hypothetical protein